MRNYQYYLTVLALMLTVSLFITACGGGGGSSTTTEDSTPQSATVVNGRIQNVIAAASPEQRSYILALLKEAVTLTKTAHAQSNSTTGIMVSAIVRGLIVDSDITDGSGMFSLTVPGGPVTFVFSTEDFSVELLIDVPGNTEISLVVTLQPNEEDDPVIIEDDPEPTPSPEPSASPEPSTSPEPSPTPMEEEDEEVMAALSCNTGIADAEEFMDEDGNVVIDGGGETCILTTGNCSLEILDAASVTLTNCERCIDTRGASDVIITTSGNFTCESTEDGIHTVGNSGVFISAEEMEMEEPEPTPTPDPSASPEPSPTPEEEDTEGAGNISITSGGDGLDARGTSDISLIATALVEEPEPSPTPDPSASPEPSPTPMEEPPSGEINISGVEMSIRAGGNPDVELSASSCILEGDILINGAANVDTSGCEELTIE